MLPVDRLSREQESIIERLLEDHGEGVMTSEPLTTAVRELADLGYLVDFVPYLDGRCRFVVGSKCAAYFEELKRAEDETKKAHRHDWALNAVNGVYGLVGAVLGAVVGFLLGKIA